MRSLRILVIAEVATLGTSVIDAMQALGAEVFVTSSTIEGFKAFAQRQPDILICEAQLPDGDGYTLHRIRDLEAECRWQQTPAVLISDSARELDLEQTLEAGFQRYLA